MDILNSIRFWNDKESDREKDHRNHGPEPEHSKDVTKDDRRYRKLSNEMEEIRKFTLKNMEDIADEFGDVRGELKDVRGDIEDVKAQNSRVQKKMFRALEKAVKRIERVEEKVEESDKDVEIGSKNPVKELETVKKQLRNLKKENEILENRINSEITRLDKQKVDGKDLARLNTGPEAPEKGKREDETREIGAGNLTKKEQAKVKILEMLKEGKSKTQIRNDVEGDICSREWFYKAWDELEKEEVYISGREEALIHPEDYKKDIID